MAKMKMLGVDVHHGKGMMEELLGIIVRTYDHCGCTRKIKMKFFCSSGCSTKFLVMYDCHVDEGLFFIVGCVCVNC